tara:strand:- start:130 stop:1092 length:963 start_codon:yes stop_codon:yes gene_type:complete
MKTLLFLLSFLCLSSIGFSQNDSISVQDTNTYRFIKTDGGELIGKILNQDAREILILTNDNRKIYLPQHTIKEMVIVNTSDFNNKGEFIGEDKFATRYFITTNGLPINKGEHYVQWNLFGPDFQFGLGKNFGVGIMTSWLGMPIIGTIKKSWEIGEKTQFAVGGLIGTGSWALPDWGGALPFGTLSFGDRSKNLAISGGYGAIWQNGDLDGRALTSIAGMIKVSPKISLVFDSFILLPGQTETITNTYEDYVYNSSSGQYEYQTVTNTYETRSPGLALLIPGVRWHQEEGKAIQFGFTGVITDGDNLPIPIPMVQWYRSL